MWKRCIVATAVGAGVVVVGGGCKHDDAKSAEAKHNREIAAQSEGRLTVDQSAVLPVDVRAGVMREYPGATVQNVTKKTLEDRKARYEVKLTTKEGKQVTREFDDSGKPTSGR